MNDIIQRIIHYFVGFPSMLSWVISGDYYGNLFKTYFSVLGFILGLVFVGLVYFACKDRDTIWNYVKLLLAIALCNSCYTILNLLGIPTLTTGVYLYYNYACVLSVADTLLSGFILTILIHSDFEKSPWQAFCFGTATFGVAPLLNFVYFGTVPEGVMIFIIARALLAGLWCIIICYRKMFFTSWIWYFSFYVLVRLGMFAHQNLIIDRLPFAEAIKLLPNFLSKFVYEGVFFIVVLAFAIVFEKAVLHLGPRWFAKRKTA